MVEHMATRIMRRPKRPKAKRVILTNRAMYSPFMLRQLFDLGFDLAAAPGEGLGSGRPLKWDENY